MAKVTFDVVEGRIEKVTDFHHHIHWTCPSCGEDGFHCLSKSEVTAYFSVDCEKDGKLFLVHWPETVH